MYKGKLAIMVADSVFVRLKAIGRVAKQFDTTASLLEERYSIRNPTCRQVIGRESEVQQVVDAVNSTGAVVVVAGPGEGKTTVTRCAARKFWDMGGCMGGVVEIDLRGAHSDRSL
jgi:stage III sporulation protein SpoIIIAA